MRTIRHFFLFLLIFFPLCLASMAQHGRHTCGTVVSREFQQLEASRGMPGYFGCNFINKVNRTLQISLHIAQNKAGATNMAAADIEEGLERLNLDFAPCGLQFEFCIQEVMPDDRFDSLSVFDYYNEEPQMTSIYFEPNTINLYLVDSLGKQDAPGVAGYAYFPGGPDVIVIKKTSFNFDSDVQSHEMGHFFGLYHTFETDMGDELVDGSNCETAGDLVCDTEADPDEDGNCDPDNFCNYTGSPTMDANSQWYVPPTDNFMSYYSDECTCRFTPQQYNRMLEQYLTLRSYLW